MIQKEESFAELFQSTLEKHPIQSGDLVTGTVVSVDDKYVTVDVGLKSNGIIPIEEFMGHDEQLSVRVGDQVEDIMVEAVVDAFGETRLSREKAKRIKTWDYLVKAQETGGIVTGLVVGKVKGGFTIDIDGIKGFLPGSLVDVHATPGALDIEGKELEFKVVKADDVHNNVVVSRRAVVEAESSAERSKLLESLEEGRILQGTVKNLTDYGAFIDLGGFDGLLHITDISWKRIKSPSEVLKLGDEVTVVVLKFDREHNRLSLGMKQLSADPWVNIQVRYAKGTKTTGKVTNLTDYGCFVEIEPGIEGLVHMSEMDWTNKNVSPSKVVQIGDEVEVMILDIDEDRRRISLGMKQCTPNPWAAFAEAHREGEVIKGAIKSITDFGIFIGLEDNIDGLVHLSDISWIEPGEQAIRQYKKGDEVEAIILVIDPERERISLGIKQLQNDPFGNYATQCSKGERVQASVTAVEQKQAWFEIAPEVVGRMKAVEFSTERIDDLTEHLKVGDKIEARITGVNHKDRVINLSMKPKDDTTEVKAKKKPKQKPLSKPEPVIKAKLGDLLKEQLESREGEEETEEEVEENTEE
jgi:small subunit ribosomal protein S1